MDGTPKPRRYVARRVLWASLWFAGAAVLWFTVGPYATIGVVLMFVGMKLAEDVRRLEDPATVVHHPITIRTKVGQTPEDVLRSIQREFQRQGQGPGPLGTLGDGPPVEA